MASDDSEEGDASSVSDSASVSFSNLGRAASSTLEYPIRGVSMLVPSIGKAGAVSPGATGTNLAVAAGGGGGASYITPDGSGVVSTGAGAGELPFFIIFSSMLCECLCFLFYSSSS